MDFHFLVRNGIAGGVFLLFAFIGVWTASPADAVAVLAALERAQSLVATAAAATPVIGIRLQSLVLMYRYSRRDVFTDDARHLVAERFRNAIRADRHYNMAFGNLLDANIDDRVFVSIYHRTAPPHLIEWARRRRSYDYLGETCAYAVVVGLIAGYFAALVAHSVIWQGTGNRLVAVACAGCAWIGAALWLARKMRQDADRMELAWAIYELAPGIGKEMQTLGQDVFDHPAGKTDAMLPVTAP